MYVCSAKLKQELDISVIDPSLLKIFSLFYLKLCQKSVAFLQLMTLAPKFKTFKFFFVTVGNRNWRAELVKALYKLSYCLEFISF